MNVSSIGSFQNGKIVIEVPIGKKRIQNKLFEEYRSNFEFFTACVNAIVKTYLKAILSIAFCFLHTAISMFKEGIV